MISKALHEALNKQINEEFASSYLYLSMAAYFDSQSLDGFSSWMKAQAQEEIAHGMKIYDYILDRDETVTMLAIEQPRVEFASPLDAFQQALDHEKELSEKLNAIAQLALEAKDNTSYSFLEWFLNEQVEEVATASTIVDKLKLIGDNGFGVLRLNDDLGKRQPGESGGEA